MAYVLELIREAEEELKRGSLAEASVKAYAAFEEAVRLAYKSAYGIDAPRSLAVAVEDMAADGVLDVTAEFGNATALMSNYYNRSLPPGIVEANLMAIKAGVMKALRAALGIASLFT